MPSSEKLELFITKIMNINVLRMGGAVSGIIGSSGTDNIILNNLKRDAVAFASEYSKTTPNQHELAILSEEIYGCLRTLQVTYTLTEQEVDQLMDEVQSLMNKF